MVFSVSGIHAFWCLTQGSSNFEYKLPDIFKTFIQLFMDFFWTYLFQMTYPGEIWHHNI